MLPDIIRTFPRWKVLLVVLISCTGLGMANAQPIISWDTTGLTDYGPSPWTGTSNLDANLTLSLGLSRGSGLDTGGTAAADIWGGRGMTTNDLNDAIAAGDFAIFTVQSETGYWVSFSSLDNNMRRSSTAADQFQWQYQIGSGSWLNAGGSWSYTGTQTNGASQPQIDLSAISALQNVTAPVSFRLVGWGGASTGTWGFGRLSGNDLVVSGSVSLIPEPSAVLFLGVGLGVLLARRRRPRP